MVYTNINSVQIKEFTGNLKKTLEYLLKNKSLFETQEVGKYEVDPDFFYMIQEYNSKEEAVWESHKKYVDIQLILNGEEIIEVSDIHHMNSIAEYDESKDFCAFEGDAQLFITMNKGDFTVFYPEDVHKPALSGKKDSSPVKKCLFKILI